jgi:hypothetical protein
MSDGARNASRRPSPQELRSSAADVGCYRATPATFRAAIWAGVRTLYRALSVKPAIRMDTRSTVDLAFMHLGACNRTKMHEKLAAFGSGEQFFGSKLAAKWTLPFSGMRKPILTLLALLLASTAFADTFRVHSSTRGRGRDITVQAESSSEGTAHRHGNASRRRGDWRSPGNAMNPSPTEISDRGVLANDATSSNVRTTALFGILATLAGQQ